MRHSLTTIIAVVAFCAGGCTNDLQAPSNYLVGDDSNDESTGPAMLMVDCGDPPLGAVGATFTHTPSAMGGDNNYTFAFENDDDAPTGLAINADTGEISGAPLSNGQFDFNIVVTDGADGTGTGMCTFEINPRLSVALDIEAPGCLSGSQSLLDVVVEGTGDGTEIVCATPGGRGNGRMPEGNSVDPADCEIAGTFTDEFFGTWVFMVSGTQSGVDVWVPYCITNDDPMGFYDVNVSHSAEPNNTLTPLIGTFPPTGAFSVGGDMDPHFTIEDEDSCGATSCNFGFNYTVTSTNFNDSNLNGLVTGDELLRDTMDNPVGMQHELVLLEGSDIPEEFRDRPWVMSLAFQYCISDTASDCMDDNIAINAGAKFHFSTLMFPDSL